MTANQHHGKVALVTGAARGQGRSHALALAAEGADIIAVDICSDIAAVPYPLSTEGELEETARQIREFGRRVVARKVDVRDMSAQQTVIDAAVAELGRLDIVVANAGIQTMGPIEEISEDAWNQVIAVNLTGVFFTARAVVPHLKRNETGGAIVITSSVAGEVGLANLAHYVASKHGVIGLMKSMANELGPFNIRVNAVLPTSVRTPMIDNPATIALFDPAGATDGTLDAVAGAYAEMQSLPFPWLDPEDVTGTVMFLVSDAAARITGSSMRVDGGAITK